MKLAQDLSGFIAAYGTQLADAAAERLKPLFDPAKDKLPDLSVIERLRTSKHPTCVRTGRQFRFFPPQVERIAGTVAALKEQRTAWMIEEMACGKAQPLDAKVLTDTGWKRMGDMKVGDTIIDPDGGTASVTGVFPQGQKQIYRVTFTDGSSTECCEDHLWSVMDTNRRFRKQPPRVLSLKQIMHEGLTIARGNNRHFIPIVTPVEFRQSASIPVDPYLLGLLLGDGGLSGHAVKFTTSDTETIHRMSMILPEYHIRKGHGTYDYTIIKNAAWIHEQQNPLVRDLKLLGLMGKRSESKFIPAIYKLGSIYTRLSVLQGLFDTDGHAYGGWGKRGPKTSVEYTTVSAMLADDVRFIVQSLGGTTKIARKHCHYVKDGVRHPCQDAYRLCIRLPNGIAPFRLRRKMHKFCGRTKYTEPTRSIASVKCVGVKEAQCIRVNSKRNLYVTDDFIVTHNTAQAIAAAWLKLRHKPSYRLLVMCPGHLVRKWKREIDWLLPNVDSRVIGNFADLKSFQADAAKSKRPMVAVIGKDTAKLGVELNHPCAAKRTMRMQMQERDTGKLYFTHRTLRMQMQERDTGKLYFKDLPVAACPKCGATLMLKQPNGGDEIPYPLAAYLEQDNPERCENCGDMLAQHWRKPGRYAKPHLDRFIQRHMRGCFDLGIFDEVHELASADSAQGNAFGTLGAACKYVLALTGTLIGGKAHDLHAPLWRMAPALVRQRGFTLHRSPNTKRSAMARNETAFIRRYGVMEQKVTRALESDGGRVTYGTRSRRKQCKSEEHPKPGISPDLFNHFLLSNAVFMSLSELGQALPSLERELVPVTPSAELAQAYRFIDNAFTDAMKDDAYKGKGPPALAMLRIQVLAAYLDRPYGWKPVTAAVYKDGVKAGTKVVVVPPDLMANGNAFKAAIASASDAFHEDAKDAKLVEIVQREVKAGRKCAIYVQNTHTRDVRPKLLAMLRRAGIRVTALPDNVDAVDREKWIEEHANEMDALAVHPKRVQTGLDLIQFPTIIWYETGFSTHVLRQASARARRPTQTLPCKIIYMFYAGTIQEQVMSLMGEKTAASEMLEGTFDCESLRCMMNGSDNDDILAALANNLDRKMTDAKTAWSALTEQKVKMVEHGGEFTEEVLFDMVEETIWAEETIFS